MEEKEMLNNIKENIFLYGRLNDYQNMSFKT